MVLTKQDLQDWNSHPVTKAIFKEIDAEITELKDQSCIKETCDQTAMQVSATEGAIQGANALKAAYETLEEASE